MSANLPNIDGLVFGGRWFVDEEDGYAELRSGAPSRLTVATFERSRIEGTWSGKSTNRLFCVAGFDTLAEAVDALNDQVAEG